MANPALLVALALACLAATAAADDSVCLSVALDSDPTYAPNGRACRRASSKADCLATVGYTSVANPGSRRASCTWRQTAENGDISESHWLYPVEEQYFFVSYDPANFNNFCSVSHKITVPPAAVSIYYAHTMSINDRFFGFNAVSQCAAGRPNAFPSSCTAPALVDPGLFLGLPRAFPLFYHVDMVFPMNGSYTFERPILMDRFFKKSCTSPSTSRDQRYRFNSAPAVFIDNSAHEMTGAFGSWSQQLTQTGMIWEWINVDFVKSVRFEATVSNSTIWPVYAYLIRSSDWDQYILDTNCGVVDCPAPLNVTIASCEFRRPGTCSATAKKFKPNLDGYGYLFVVSRAIIAGTVFSDDKFIKAAWTVDADLNRTAFSATGTTARSVAAAAVTNNAQIVAAANQAVSPFLDILG